MAYDDHAERLTRTPPDARLVDLPGPVLRLVRMVELHVHDFARLRAAARTAGWRSPDREDDAVGAAMFLVGDAPPVPGADLISEESSGELLRADLGDEIAAWSIQPVTADFLTGWELDEVAAEPVGARSGLLRPALTTLVDEAYDDIAEHGDTPVTVDGDTEWFVFDRLPRSTWGQDTEWRRHVARSAERLLDDLENGGDPVPRCPAEAVMLELAVADTGMSTTDTEDVPGKPSGAGDTPPSSRGIPPGAGAAPVTPPGPDAVTPASPASLASPAGIAPEHWFTPFDDPEPPL